jgi:D-glycero-beta-D-manno-heptose-7-phosphate kinase
MVKLKQQLEEFKNKNIAVIGDVMLDKYIFGKVDRISPEAPVQIVSVSKESYVPGGAANAACNVSTLEGNSFLFGIVGNDMAKEIFIDEVRRRGINSDGIIVDGRKPTIQKIRVIAQNQQLLRIDYEDKNYNEPHTDGIIIESIKNIKEIHAILISDYAKGTITKNLMASIKEHAKKNDIKIIVDPKPIHKELYHGVFLITPNKKEAEELSGIIIETNQDIEKAGKKLSKELNCNVLITMGEKGMSMFEINKDPIHIPTAAREVYDVSGAGDTVIATLCLALSSGISLSDAATLANHAAGVKVSKLGTAPVTMEELLKSLKEDGLI